MCTPTPHQKEVQTLQTFLVLPVATGLPPRSGFESCSQVSGSQRDKPGQELGSRTEGKGLAMGEDGCSFTYLFVYIDRVPLCNPGYPGTCYMDQDGT